MCKFGKIAVFISFPGFLCSSSLFFLPSFSLPCLFLSSFPHPFFSFFLPSLRPSSLHFPFISLIFPSLSFHYPLLLPFLSLSFHLYSRAVVVVSACCRFCGDYGRCLGFLVSLLHSKSSNLFIKISITECPSTFAISVSSFR